MPLLAIPIIIFIFFIILIIVLWILNKKRRHTLLLPDYTDTLPKNASFEFITKEEVLGSTYNEKNEILTEIKSLAPQFQKLNISSVYLVHGTFVGDDPLHIISLIHNSLPNINSTIIEKLKQGTKKGQNLMAKDLGNFIQEHIIAAKNLSDSDLRVENFTWSSANHHLARIIGALKLAKNLAENHNKDERILLFGHSHAGQLFAILTQLINNPSFRKKLKNILSSEYELNDKFEETIKDLKTFRFDFVTFGTPSRYEWNLNGSMSLIHFINHRRKDVLGGSAKGATFTRSGDYIQQWGIAGSDLASPIKKEKGLNQKLDKILGPGNNFELLKENLKLRKRLHNEGHHFLTNYNDDSKTPNFYKTIFGHGSYTKSKFFPFHLNKVITHLVNHKII